MALFERWKTPLEKLLEQRGFKAAQGGYKPWNLPGYAPTTQAIRNEGARNLEDVGRMVASTGMSGPAAGKVLEDVGDQTSRNILNYTASLEGVPESYIGSGVEAGGAGVNRALQVAQVGMAKDAAEQAKKTQKASIGNPCVGNCMIMTEGWTRRLQEPVRLFRDEHFAEDSYVSKGYTSMSRWLVPLLLKSRIARFVIRKVMLNPINKAADFYYGNGGSLASYPLAYFWVRVWGAMGRMLTK